MAEDDHRLPGLLTLVGRLGRTGLGALQNRFELLVVEWQQERARLAGLLVWVVSLLFLGIMGVMLLTATVIFLFAEELRVYVAAGFTVLYLVGAAGAWLALRSRLKREPFTDSLDQLKKDRLWLESLK